MKSHYSAVVVALLTLITTVKLGTGAPSLNFTCPKGYQAFHTFHTPLDNNKYRYQQDCVKFENKNCVQECYWASESHNRTRGDCSYFWDTMVTRKDIYFEGKKAVYASGFRFDNYGNIIDRAYCCISLGSITDKCEPRKHYYGNWASRKRSISSDFPSLRNPITRSVDVMVHDGTSTFDYVLEACSTELVVKTCDPQYKRTRNVDIDECMSNPCLNDGTCTDGLNGHTCTCKDGYTGLRCQTGTGYRGGHELHSCNTAYKGQTTKAQPPYMCLCKDELATASNLDWVRSTVTGETCSDTCTSHAMQAELTGTDKDGNRFYICSTPETFMVRAGVKDRPGFQLPGFKNNDCAIGWGNDEHSSEKLCLCTK